MKSAMKGGARQFLKRKEKKRKKLKLNNCLIFETK